MSIEDQLAKQDAERDINEETTELQRCIHKDNRTYLFRRAKDVILFCYQCHGYDVTCPFYRTERGKKQ